MTKLVYEQVKATKEGSYVRVGFKDLDTEQPTTRDGFLGSYNEGWLNLRDTRTKDWNTRTRTFTLEEVTTFEVLESPTADLAGHVT